MRTKLSLAALAVVVLELLLTTCAGGDDRSNLKQIQQQRAGDYVVTARDL